VKIRIVRSNRDPGKFRFRVVGRHGAYPVAQDKMPLKGTLVIDSPIARTGQCGEAVFKETSLTPRCVLNASGTTLRCR